MPVWHGRSLCREDNRATIPMHAMKLHRLRPNSPHSSLLRLVFRASMPRFAVEEANFESTDVALTCYTQHTSHVLGSFTLH